MNPTEGAARPLIGLTTYLEAAGTDGCGRVEAAFLPQKYMEPIIAAGGVPLLLPPQPVTAPAVERLVSTIDGLLIPGGWDVDPSLYGQERHAETDQPRTGRDAWEQALILEAIRQDVPLFGICRGEQLLNVTLGGTLHQHLPDVIGSAHYQAGGHRFNTIPVEIRPGSTLGGLLGPAADDVPVSHHQAVDKLGRGLMATAWSPEQVVEAIEHPGLTFCVGVQWHPEQIAGEEVLFQAFVDAAAGKMLSRLLPALDLTVPQTTTPGGQFSGVGRLNPLEAS
jgi:putative glutamine amidotransferase